MQILDPTDLQAAAQVLKDGGVLAHPADTCYGLAADLSDPSALKKLQQIKERAETKVMSIMLPVFMKANLEDYVELSEFASFVCERLLPGPVTIVLPKGPQIPDHYFPEYDTIGIRIPYDPACGDLLTKFGRPIITTSANLSNGQPCYTSDEVIAVFKDLEHRPTAVMLGKIANRPLPSTVLEVKGETISILRQGPLSKEQIGVILGLNLA